MIKTLRSDKHFTTVEIKAKDREQLVAEVQRYLREYDPAGYATRVSYLNETTATISRYSSCD